MVTDARHRCGTDATDGLRCATSRADGLDDQQTSLGRSRIGTVDRIVAIIDGVATIDLVLQLS